MMQVVYSVLPTEGQPAVGPAVVPPVGTEHTAEQVADTEFFVREAFKVDPQRGCELLFRLYYQPLCTHAVRFVYAKDVAEDLVADVFYTFWNTRAYLSVQQSYRGYLFRSVRNRTYNYIAHELKPSDQLDSVANQPLSTEEPEAIMRFDELHHKVDLLVDGLPPQCRKVFILNRFEGRRAKDIAAELQISVRTVEVHIAKALSVLRSGLRDHWLLWAVIVGLGESLTQIFFD